MFQEILVCGKLDNFCRITQGNIVSFDKTDTGGLRGVSAATYLLFTQNLLSPQLLSSRLVDITGANTQRLHQPQNVPASYSLQHCQLLLAASYLGAFVLLSLAISLTSKTRPF